MQNVMWIQSDNPGGKDYLFIDGVLTDEQDEVRRAKAMSILLNAQEAKYQREKYIKKIRSESGSPNLTLAQCVTMGFLYKSVFNEKASDGRYKAFVFWCRNSDAMLAWNTTKANGRQLNYSLRENELPLIKAYLKKKKIQRVSFACVTFLIIVLAYVVIH